MFKTKPTLETLEDRLALTANVIGGDLYVTGTEAADTVSVHYAVSGGVGYYKVVENGATSWHLASRVYNNKVNFYGKGGNDGFDLWTSRLRVLAEGGAGNDTLLGHNKDDTMMGGEGNDQLYGYGGVDELSANGGTANVLYGGDGNDYLYGWTGNDSLYGQNGDDWLYGRGGNDTLFGNAGVDKLYGEEGHDVLSGGVDGVRDTLVGGTGTDLFRRELYWVASVSYNRDQPLDFSSSQGDSYYD